jgi:hypothetical protein
MKKFISAITHQSTIPPPALYSIDSSCGFDSYTPTFNPVVPFIANRVDQGEEIEVIIIEYSSAPNREEHTKNLINEIDSLKEKKGFSYKLTTLTVQSPADNKEYMKLTKELILLIKDHDELFVDITYGQKPLAITQFAALAFAYKIRKDVEIGALSYGDFDHKNKVGGSIFDLTHFFLLIDTINNISGMPNADKLVEKLISNLIEE